MVSRAGTWSALAFGFAFVAAPVSASCDPPDTRLPRARASLHPVTSKELIELWDIGSLSSPSFWGPSPLAVSPDGKHVAYLLTRADLASNGYCRALVVSSSERPDAPTVLDLGGDVLLVEEASRGHYLPSGGQEVTTPIWSADGRAIAYRRRDHGRTRAWVADTDGGAAREVSTGEADVQVIAWSDDGRLLYGTRANARSEEEAITQEGKRGWHYDARVNPEISARPAPAVASAYDVAAVDVGTGKPALVKQGDAAKLGIPDQPAYTIDPAATGDQGQRAWAEHSGPSPVSPLVIKARVDDHTVLTCAATACRGSILSLWWREDALYFLKRTGWNDEQMELHRWRAGSPNTRRLLRTADVLHGCVMADAALVCTQETSAQPRQLVRIELATGHRQILYDPNPAFGLASLGPIRRLRWRSGPGLESWGDLVLPPGHRSGERLPLVVVQYHSVGFLRGGTGDEYPIFPLAQKGFAVLSIERPRFGAGTDPSLSSWDAINAANQRGWTERKNLLESVLTGVDQAIATGAVDPERIGITGLSDGSATVSFALIHSRRFAAAAISTCCMEPVTTMALGGTAWADQLQQMGYPPLTSEGRQFWHDMSLAQNAPLIKAPLLLQLSDDEFRLALESYAALREQRKPVDIYVFPNESHIRWQPVHRSATYERTMDWFSFWLQGLEDPDPGKASQFALWRGLRAVHAQDSSASQPH